MKVEIRKAAFFDEWLWTCPVCHDGYNIPWESVRGWPEAVAAVGEHIALHQTAGMRLEWADVELASR